jgi:hypothetical protein
VLWPVISLRSSGPRIWVLDDLECAHTNWGTRASYRLRFPCERRWCGHRGHALRAWLRWWLVSGLSSFHLEPLIWRKYRKAINAYLTLWNRISIQQILIGGSQVRVLCGHYRPQSYGCPGLSFYVSGTVILKAGSQNLAEGMRWRLLCNI